MKESQKKEWEKAEAESIEINAEDIISTSGDGKDNDSGGKIDLPEIPF